MSTSPAPLRALPVRTRGCCVDLAPPLAPDRATQLAGVFRALGDPTRVQMVRLLRDAADPVCVCDLVAAFDLGQPTISHHLARLRDASLVTSTRRGVWTFHELNRDLAPAVRAIVDQVA